MVSYRPSSKSGLPGGRVSRLKSDNYCCHTEAERGGRVLAGRIILTPTQPAASKNRGDHNED